MNLSKLRTMSLGEVHYRLKMSGAKKVRALLQDRYREAMTPGRYLRQWRLPEPSPLFRDAVSQAKWPQAEEALLQHMRARILDGQDRRQAPCFFIDLRHRAQIVDIARGLPNMADQLDLAVRLLERLFWV